MKMKKIFLLAMVAMTGVATSCQYDDDEVWDSVNNLADRVTSLETLTKQMNSDIAAMKSIISALEKQVMVSEVEELADGYIIHFTDGTKATIKNGADGKDGANGANGTNGEDGKDGADGKDGEDGKDGADGKDGQDGKDGKDAPIIGVAQENGVYYWTLTLDGKTEWLTDEAGNKMRVTGEDGKDGEDGADGEDGKDGENGKDGVDGKAPVVTIVNDIWHINGQSTGKSAKGAKGQDATDSMFESLVEKDGKLVITLVRGDVYEVPVEAEVTYEDAYGDEVSANEVKVVINELTTLTYTVKNMSDVLVEVFNVDEGLTVDPDENAKTLTITATQTVFKAKVVLLYYNANRTITSVLKVTTE